MKKVFILHGFEGSPNGGWRPWLMGELEKLDVYSCALAMPSPEAPMCTEWVEEIARHCTDPADEIYLVGHSLGVPAILRYLETPAVQKIKGAVLVSGPSEKNQNRKIDSFLETGFDFATILEKCPRFAIIQGDNDKNVPAANAEFLSENLNAELTWIQNGGHLNGSAGWYQLPQCLGALKKLISQN